MPQIKPDVEAFARIKVLGVGGSGKNALNHMINSKVRGVDFIAINTDSIKGADMVFITCGLGGGTGTGAAPIIARISREMGALTVAVITKPFFFEGQQRMKLAESGLEELRQAVDAIIVIPNDRLLSTITKETTAKSAFATCDDVLKSAVEGISDLITTPGIINIDFADIRAIMENAGSALMGIGTATGEKRAEEAAKMAINSPLLEVSINGAKGVLFSIAGGDDLGMFEIQDAAKLITESVDPNARIIFGTVKDEKLKKGEVKITVIASNFPENFTKKTLFQSTQILSGDKEKENNKEEKGKIFNSIPAQMQEVTEKTEITDDDEWGAVPAFLRRSKLK
ncbi:MAG: cell division protein FtsZ [Candidatus Zambryskibacteria bacterium]|nr:cell division protein FtsZ [Candidatus Zambryskibacteria bacterium]